VDLVLLRTRAGIRVYEGRCPHQGALLGEGEVEGNALVCRNHGWRFEVETGRRIGPGTECLRACPAREDGGDILVEPSGLIRPAAPGAAPTRTLADLPGPRPAWILGNALQLEPGRIHQTFERPRKMLVISDPTLAEAMYRARPETYRRPSPIEPIFDELRVSGVFSAEGDAWRAQRRLAMEALSLRHLRGFYPTLAHVARRLVRRWSEAADTGRELDVNDELKRFTVDVTTQLVFGHDLNTLEKGDEDIIQRHLELLFPAFERRLHALLPYWRYFRLPIDRRVDRAVDSIYAWLTTVITQARANLEASPERAANPSNFVEAMLAAHDAEGRPFSDDVIFGNALTMLLAGEDTTAYTLAWAMHHLCDAPESVAALRREADAVMPADPVPADVEQANRLAYAAAVGNEAMRLRPVAPAPLFEPVVDVVVGDVAVPKGTTVVTLLRPATRDAARFHAPGDFAPERWINAGADGKAHDASVHVPFGSGPRICPGRSLALLEIRVALAAIYKSFHVERVGASADVREHLAFTMSAAGLRVRVRRR
jgi:cytochrome P450